jgi:hypothetical protein
MHTLTTEQIEQLQSTAKIKMASEDEDFEPCDFSGGNFDDAYYMGVQDGEIEMARKMLDYLNIKY